MKFFKNVKSILASTLILSGLISSSSIISYANTNLENNSSINLESNQTNFKQNENIIIKDGDAQIVLTPVKVTVEDKNGLIKEFDPETYATYAKEFSVQLQQTVTKSYNVEVGYGIGTNYTLAAKATVNVKVKCTGEKKILATSSISNIKSLNGYVASSGGTTSGSIGSSSSTTAKIKTSRGGVTKTMPFTSSNSVIGSSGSAQGYQVVVRQLFK